MVVTFFAGRNHFRGLGIGFSDLSCGNLGFAGARPGLHGWQGSVGRGGCESGRTCVFGDLTIRNQFGSFASGYRDLDCGNPVQNRGLGLWSDARAGVRVDLAGRNQFEPGGGSGLRRRLVGFGLFLFGHCRSAAVWAASSPLSSTHSTRTPGRRRHGKAKCFRISEK
ncbi:hypothetical protein SBA4_260009 [Candidatus Sulfopaludibacter sp. SbA4]|nr:hypothetical protein SBA4_260009 [Candidatus Sulfopaludibacter sp. SbA4]